MATANVKAVITADDRASKTIQGVGSSFTKMAGAMAVGQMAANALQKGMDVLVDTLKTSITASFNQVKQVEQATVALRAYEKNGDKVNGVLKDLIKYARSDLGVLFQREDLFGAAQQLKIMGDNTGDLVDHVKIMSRSVGLGLSTWQGLNNVIGRVGATGKLYADDLQYLQNAGFKLDNSLSGTSQTFQTLFAHLDKGIPAEALAGQANTINGKFVRLQSALRDFGGTILGVDKATSTFIKGGLGDYFMNAVVMATEVLKNPKIVLDQLKESFDFIMPSIIALWNTVKNQVIPMFIDLWNALKPLGPVIGTALVSYIWLAVNAFNIWFKSVTVVWNVLIAVLNFITGSLVPGIQAAFNWIVSKAIWLKDNFWSVTGQIIGFFATLPIKLPILVAQAMAGAVRAVLNVNWGSVFSGIGHAMQGVWNQVKQMAVNTWQGIRSIDWGGALVGIGKSMANAVIGLIEGAINGALKGIPTSPSVSLPRFAQGTNFAPGGSALVGERGPEIVNLPRGSSVTPNNQISRNLGGGGSNINITFSGIFTGNEMEFRKLAIKVFQAAGDVAGMQNNDITGMTTQNWRRV